MPILVLIQTGRIWNYSYLDMPSGEKGDVNLSAFTKIDKWIECFENTPGYKKINDLLDGNNSVEHPIAARAHRRSEII